MGLRFRKSVKIAPGVKINFNKKSSSVTFGGKGIHYTVNSKGKKTASVGIPGTGISYTQSSGGGSGSKSHKNTKGGEQATMPQNNFQGSDPNKKWYQKTGWIIALLIFFFPVGLFLMWKYTNWKKPVKGIVTAFILLFAFIGFASPSLEQITLKAKTDDTYDINQKVKITATTDPTDYELSKDDFQCSGGKLKVSDKTLSFTATTAGSYNIWAEHNGVKSNTLVVNVEDKTAIAKKEAEEKAKKEAEEKAAQEKAAQEAAAAKAKAEAEAAAQAQAQAEAQQQAQAAAQAQAQQQQAQAQQQTGEIVYWVPNGQVYHSTQDCPSLGRSSTIYSGTIAQSGKSRPCKNCY